MDQSGTVFDLNRQELGAFIEALDQPSYRADQIWDWIYGRLVLSPDDMTNLPKALRKELRERLNFTLPSTVISQSSKDGLTNKVLFKLADGKMIETVLMRYDKRRTICISTQVGCAMGCVFCATGQMGFSRNLMVGEIVSQVVYFARLLAAEGSRLTNIVVMGMGEPLHNYDHTLAAVDIFTDKRGLNIGARKIVLSTVGLVPAIRRYADERRQTPLAISLHAASDEERTRLIPIANRWPLKDLMDACRYYVAQSKRLLTFEWALIRGENDTDAQAHQLGSLLHELPCKVNLIPLNPTTGFGGRPSSREQVARFQEILAQYGIRSTVRVRRGLDIDAGCGQLYGQHSQRPSQI